jgi:hypothetical protein
MGALSYPVIYRTDESVDQVEAMLSAHCEGRWHVELETDDATGKVESPVDRMNLRVLFERESDIQTLCQPRV